MDKLWQTRLRRHQKEQAKYLQRVFNDHFVLVLLVLFGALLYAYSQFVQGIVGRPWWVTVVIAGVCAVSLPFGRLATLLVPADQVFLLPQVGAMQGYLRQAVRYSLLLPCVLQLGLSFALWPLMSVGTTAQVTSVVALILTQLALAVADMHLQAASLYQARFQAWRRWLMVLDFVLVGAGLLTTMMGAMLIAIIIMAIIVMTTNRVRQQEHLHLPQMITQEGARMATIYRFYNLFTDVPGLGGGVSRRRYLDGLVHRVPAKHDASWSYLFVRGLIRSQEYFGLCVRLTIVGAIMVIISPTWWLILLINLLFSYLLGYQLLPLATRYRDVVFTHLYPLPVGARAAAWAKLVTIVLLVQAIIIGLVGLIHSPSLLTLAAFAAGVAFVPLLVRGYLVRRVQ